MNNPIGERRPFLTRERFSRTWIGLAIILAIAGTLVLISTRWGAALNDDSYWYIKPARDALEGQPMQLHSIYAPLFPIVLAGLGALGPDPWEAVRYLNTLLLPLTVLLTFLIVDDWTGSSVIALMASAAIMASSELLELYASALSEPLYLTLMLAAAWSLLVFNAQGDERWLLVSAIGSGLALSTRYAGLAVVAALGLFILTRPMPLRERLRQGTLFGLVSAIPISIYLVRNYLTIDRLVGQSEFSWLLVRQFPLRLLLRNVINWVIPARLIHGHEYQIVVLFLLLSAGTGLAVWRMYRGRLSSLLPQVITGPTPLLMILMTLAHLLMLGFARGFFSGGNPFNPRYLAPVQVSVLILTFGYAGRWRTITGGHSKLIVTMACAGLLAVLAARATYTVWFLHTEGSGYASRRWHVSETIAYINRRPDVPVMSTAEPGVYFWTGRLPLRIPRRDVRASVKDFLCETDGILVVIDSVPPELYGVDRTELTAGLVEVRDFSEGTVYRIPAGTCD